MEKVEIIKTKMDINRMKHWVSFMYDQYKGDRDRILEKMMVICQDRFFYDNNVENAILELVERI